MSRKLSFGRRLMAGASRFVSPRARWRLFRLPSGVRHLAELDLPEYRRIDAPPESTLGRTGIDVIRDRTVFRVDNGFATHGGATLLPDGTIIRELSREWRTTPGGHAKLQKPTLLPKIHRVPKAVSIAIEHNSNYCHFFYDCLPRIPILRETGFDHLPLYAPLGQPFQREILDLLGFPKDRLLASVEHPVLQADELYVPCYDGNQGEFPPNVRKFIRDELLANALKRRPEGSPPRRLYISRSDSTSRRILNEDALFAALKPLGFEFLVMAQMPMLDQILAFAHAECIVTPHGASLTNLVFSRPDSIVLEIFPCNLHVACYVDLARLMDMRYFEFRGDGIQVGNGELAQDIRLDAETIRAIADQARALLQP